MEMEMEMKVVVYSNRLFQTVTSFENKLRRNLIAMPLVDISSHRSFESHSYCVQEKFLSKLHLVVNGDINLDLALRQK